MSKETYAICATAFFIAFAIVVAFSGPSVIATALLIGAVSQFTAQDDSKYAWIAANILAYVAMILAAFAAFGY